jgi:hypothetical protein
MFRMQRRRRKNSHRIDTGICHHFFESFRHPVRSGLRSGTLKRPGIQITETDQPAPGMMPKPVHPRPPEPQTDDPDVERIHKTSCMNYDFLG